MWLFPRLIGMMTTSFHIQRHSFSPEEVEEVFAGAHKVRRARRTGISPSARRSTGDWHASYSADYPEASCE